MKNYDKYITRKIDRGMITEYIGYFYHPNKNKCSFTENFYCLCDCGKEFFYPCNLFISLLDKKDARFSCGFCTQTKDSPPTNNPNHYTFDDKCAYIHLDNKNEVAIIDKEDYEKVKNHRWCLSGRYFSSGFIKNWKYGTYGLHRVIMDCYDKNFIVDHINRNTLDNRKENLRVVSKSQNAMNCKLNYKHKYGYAGIYKSKTGWRALIPIKTKPKSLGVFKTLDEAINARKDAEIKYFNMNRVYW